MQINDGSYLANADANANAVFPFNSNPINIAFVAPAAKAAPTHYVTLRPVQRCRRRNPAYGGMVAKLWGMGEVA